MEAVTIEWALGDRDVPLVKQEIGDDYLHFDHSTWRSMFVSVADCEMANVMRRYRIAIGMPPSWRKELKNSELPMPCVSIQLPISVTNRFVLDLCVNTTISFKIKFAGRM